MSNTARSIGEWNPLMTTLLVWAISCTQQVASSGEEVCKALRIKKRTLQQYRDDGLVSYVTLPGKMLYKESDILALLQQNYIPAFVHENRGNLLPL